MTPEEKAKELVKKFEDENYFDYSTILENAKHNALIAVDEIHRLLINYSGRELPVVTSDSKRQYWQEVKQEIKKL